MLGCEQAAATVVDLGEPLVARREGFASRDQRVASVVASAALALRPSPLLGAAIALGAAIMMAGWLLQQPAIVQVAPGFLMVFNTAFGFATAGFGLMAGAFPSALQHRVRSGTGLILVTLGALVLAQYFFGVGLGIDWPDLHAWMIDPYRNPAPGRMSAPTCLGFMLSGAVFIVMPRVRGTAEILLVRSLTAAIAGLGGIAIAGYVLRLADMTETYWLSQVSLPTASGFVLLALGLWLDWRSRSWNALRLIRGEEARIVAVGTLVLAACVAATGIAIFWLMQATLERALAADLGFALKNRKALIAATIERAIDGAGEVAARPNILRIYSEPSNDPKSSSSPAFLPTVASTLVRSGFSAFAFLDAGGGEIARSGAFLDASELRIGLRMGSRGHRAELLWGEGLVVEIRADIVKDGIRLGAVRAQQRLDSLRGVMTNVVDGSESSEFGLCGLRGGMLQCAPTRFQPRVFEVPAQIAGQRLPMSYALEGVTGTMRLTDYRGKRVLAAYTPLDDLGAGLVLKVDLSEINAPIRGRIAYLLLILLLAGAAGGWVLHRGVHPLARRLAESEDRLRLALDNSKLALWDWDIGSDRVHLSEQWAELLGQAARDVDTTARELMCRVHPDDAPEVRSQIRALLLGTSSRYDIEHRVRTDSGAWKWIRSRGRTVSRAPDGRALRAIGTTVDISERKAHELHLSHSAGHDSLTALPNRSLFNDRLEQALQRSRRTGALMAVVYVDVDKFKGVNDMLGHAAGDALLKEFARRLATCVRATDTVARLGGDEFAVIVEALRSRDDGLQIAGGIVAAMRADFVLDHLTASVSASVGIAFHDGAGGVGCDEIVKEADRALYDAKAAGRDRYCVAVERSASGVAA